MIEQKRGLNMAGACSYIGGISRNGMYRLLREKLLRSYLIGNRIPKPEARGVRAQESVVQGRT